MIRTSYRASHRCLFPAGRVEGGLCACSCPERVAHSASATGSSGGPRSAGLLLTDPHSLETREVHFFYHLVLLNDIRLAFARVMLELSGMPASKQYIAVPYINPHNIIMCVSASLYVYLD